MREKYSGVYIILTRNCSGNAKVLKKLRIFRRKSFWRHSLQTENIYFRFSNNVQLQRILLQKHSDSVVINLWWKCIHRVFFLISNVALVPLSAKHSLQLQRKISQEMHLRILLPHHCLAGPRRRQGPTVVMTLHRPRSWNFRKLAAEQPLPGQTVRTVHHSTV